VIKVYERITIAIANPNKGLMKYCATNPTPTCKEENNHMHIYVCMDSGEETYCPWIPQTSLKIIKCQS
jgi:hypothetical protein